MKESKEVKINLVKDLRDDETKEPKVGVVDATGEGEEGKKVGLPQDRIDKAVKKIVQTSGVFNKFEVHGNLDRITANSLPVVSAQALKNLIDNFGMQALQINGGVSMYFPAETLAKHSLDGDSKNE